MSKLDMHVTAEMIIKELHARIAQLEAENERLKELPKMLTRLADWLERVDKDPLGALDDGYPSPQNVVAFLRQRKWEIDNAEALKEPADE